MKRKLFGIITIAIVAVITGYKGYNMYTSQNNEVLSDLTLANIEAIANGENGGYSCSATANCYFGDRIEGSISCTGIESCTSSYEYVECDGHKNMCL